MSRPSPWTMQGLIIGTVLLGSFIAVFPVSPQFSALRPELICLFVIYWVIHTPQQVGIFYAWCIGLFQDMVEGSVWGAHAMALAIVAYICIMAYQRIKNYSIWHQTLWVFVLIGFHQVIINWIQSMAGYHTGTLRLLLSTAVSAMCWPIVFLSISRLRALYRLHF